MEVRRTVQLSPLGLVKVHRNPSEKGGSVKYTLFQFLVRFSFPIAGIFTHLSRLVIYIDWNAHLP